MTRELARQIAGISDAPPSGDELFFRTLERLIAFRAANGRRPEPMTEADDEARLGRWLEAQRGDLHRGTLFEPHRSLLDDVLGPDWGFDQMPTTA
jgi:hypothetical protein